MKVGIGLPTTIPGVQRDQVLDWSRRADAAGFSTLGTLDRLIYPNWEPLVALGAAAAVTVLESSVYRASTKIVVGGMSDQAFRRAAESGDGWMLGGGSPQRFTELSEKLMAAWRERGREGEPRRLALTYFALGDDPEGDTDRSIRDYYSSTPDYADAIVAVTAKGDDAVRERLGYFRGVGVDEVVMFPASADPEQVDLLARVAL